MKTFCLSPILIIILLFLLSKDGMNVAKSYTWIHSDVMDDNIQMEQCSAAPCSLANISDPSPGSNGFLNGSKSSGQSFSWHPCHIIDFSDLTLGECNLLKNCRCFQLWGLMEFIPFSLSFIPIFPVTVSIISLFSSNWFLIIFFRTPHLWCYPNTSWCL